MTAAALLEGLKARGATVAANGDRLKLTAPHGVLKPRVLDFAAKHKSQILELLKRDPFTPGIVPSAEGQQQHGSSIMPIKATIPADCAHYDERAENGSTPDADQQTRRIRKLAALETAEELLASYRKIEPALKKSLNETNLHELALTLAVADKREKLCATNEYRPASKSYPARAPQFEGTKEVNYR